MPLLVRSLRALLAVRRRSTRPWWSPPADALAQARDAAGSHGPWRCRRASSPAAPSDRIRCAAGWRRVGRRRPGRHPRRRAAVRHAATCVEAAIAAAARTRRGDRRRAGHRHGQAGRTPDGWIEATPPRAAHLAGADAAGLPRRPDPRGPRAARAAAAATDDAALVERLGHAGARRCRQSRRTARSRRPTTCAGRSGCWRSRQRLVEAAGAEALQVDASRRRSRAPAARARAPSRTSGSARRGSSAGGTSMRAIGSW